MPRRLKLYLIVRKIFSLAYKLDLPIDNCIHFMISIVYLIWYYVRDNLYNCILPPPGLMEYGAEFDSILGDDELDGKRWELEHIVDYKIKRSTV